MSGRLRSHQRSLNPLENLMKTRGKTVTLLAFFAFLFYVQGEGNRA